MKKKITLTIEEELIERASHYSRNRGKSLSKAVEDYFHVLGIWLREEDEKEEAQP